MMMTFSVAKGFYKKGIMVKSIVSNKIYALGIIELSKATNCEVNGFWLIIK